MNKRIVPIKKHGEMLEKLRGDLGWKCCVLITCSEPSQYGKMEVEMNFEGDEHLASFLVDSAAEVFEERFSLRETK
jgi:hypothetical protein